MFLLIEVNSNFDVFEVSKNKNFIDILTNITEYEGIHFINNGKVICSISLKNDKINEKEAK
jgi:hypothetical protein